MSNRRNGITRLLGLGALACAAALLISGCRGSAYNGKPMWTGRTTLMETRPAGTSGQKDPRRGLEELGHIATSQKVLTNAAVTLGDLGMKCSPEEILGHTNVQPIKDTSILAIEVTMPDAAQAKVAADVISAEIRKAYANLNTAPLKRNRQLLEGQLKAARQNIVKSYAAVERYGKQNGTKQTAELATLKADAKAATNTYTTLRTQLDEAKLREQQAKSDPGLRTVDPAYVFKAR